MKIIPAIDIIDGKCVRLTKGDYSTKKIYNENPIEVAKEFESHGIRNLHLVDLDGAKSKHIVNYKVLESIATKTNLEIDFGGGIKSDEDIRIAFESGANQVTGGSVAVKEEERFISWLKKYGKDKLILGADVKEEKIAVNGWEETTAVELFPFLDKYLTHGIQYVICTDIAKDGLLSGSSIDLYRKIQREFLEIKLIASGGVTSLDELVKLRELGLYGAIIGKAIYEGKINLKELEKEVIL